MKVNRDLVVAGGRYAAVGFEFAGAIVGGMLAGYFLDDYAGTQPLFTILFTLAGLYGAVRVLLWTLKKNNR
jgi:F0F1-type ATP synthase assembly protein I